MEDSIESLLRDIDQQLRLMEDASYGMTIAANNAVVSCNGITEALYSARNEAWNRAYSQHAVTVAAVGRTHDTEIVLSKAYTRSLIARFTPDSLSFSEGDVIVNLTPIGLPFFDWNSGPTDVLPAESLEIVMRWRLETNLSNPREIRQIVRFTASLNAAKDELHFHLLSACRYTDEFGNKSDPFRMVPMKNGRRRAVRSQMHDEVVRLLTSQKVSIPAIDILKNGKIVRPHSVLLHNNQLLLSARTLEKRRTTESLVGRLSGGTDIGVRLNRAIVEPVLHEKLSQLELDLDSLVLERVVFNNGYLLTTVHGHKHHKESYIDVYVDVWMTHYIFIRQRGNARLMADASWQSWDYKMKSPNCFPVCDRVKREAWNAAEDEIEKAKQMTIEFADLSGIARFAKCTSETYGLLFELTGLIV